MRGVAMFDIKNLRTYASLISDSSDRMAKSWRSILMASGLVMVLTTIALIVFAIWQGRTALATAVYKTISKGVESAPILIDPWYLVPAEEFPEFWSCEKGGCVVDATRKQGVKDVIENLRGDLGSVRAVYSIYGATYRRIAAQTKSPGQRELGQELWIVPLSQDGYNDNLVQHQLGRCNSIVVAELEPGSLLRVEAPAYNLAYGQNCPTDQEDIAYKIKGYVSVDFAEVPADLSLVESKLRQAAEDIEAVMGYDE